MKLTRRLMLRLFARSGLALGFGSMAAGAVAQEGVASQDGLDPAIRRTFERYLDTLIPDEEGGPGTVTAGVGETLTAAAEAVPQARKLIVEGCRWLDGEAEKAGARSFAELGEEDRNTIVGRAAQSAPQSAPRRFFDQMREITFFLYYGSDAGWQAIGYDGPPQPIGFPDYAEPPEGRS